MSSYATEVDIKHALGIDTWRNVSKEKVLGFLQAMPQMDPEVALQVLSQVPEITSLAREAVEDATKTYDATIAANDRSHEMAHEFAREGLAILREELARDNPTAEERMAVLTQVSDAVTNVLAKDTENKQFVAQRHGQTLATIGSVAVTVVGVVIAAAWTGRSLR